MRKVDREKAEKVADTWISDATELKVVKKNDLVRNARLYLSLKELISRHEGDVVTMATWHLSESHNREGQKTNVMLPMSILEFGKEHIPCSCRCHLDCLITMMVGTYLTGGCMGFDGDVLNDWSFKPTGARPKDVIVVGHCGAPINPHGNDRIPYLTTDQTVRRIGWIPGCRIEIPKREAGSGSTDLRFVAGRREKRAALLSPTVSILHQTPLSSIDECCRPNSDTAQPAERLFRGALQSRRRSPRRSSIAFPVGYCHKRW